MSGQYDNVAMNIFGSLNSCPCVGRHQADVTTHGGLFQVHFVTFNFGFKCSKINIPEKCVSLYVGGA